MLVICDAGKANWLHGLAGRIWMSTVVQLMASTSLARKIIRGKDSLRLILTTVQTDITEK